MTTNETKILFPQFLKGDKMKYQRKDIEGFPGYEIDTDGNVFSVRFGKEKKLKPNKAKSGHLSIRLFKNKQSNKKLIHRLVLETFVGPCPKNMECRHFPDRDPANNRLDNLSWGTRFENAHDRKAHGTNNTPNSFSNGTYNGNTKLHKCEVEEIRRLSNLGVKNKMLSKMFKVAPNTISAIIHRHRWRHAS
jgi:hypothetical protein